MIRQPLIAVVLLTLSLPVATDSIAQDQRPFARFPDVSPDGRTVAFSFQGDIWTVPVDGGRAVRLTIHEAYESHPRFSPDGTRLAFMSDRYGSDDIFVMELDNGAPRRLTYHSATDVLSDWTPDDRLLFETRRTYAQVEREREIYQVSADGGTPDRLLDALGYTPVMSPDGRFIAFAFRTNGEWRKGYRGPANKDIWLHDTRDGGYSRLTDFAGNDIRPQWSDSRTLLFVSERDGTYNLYRLRLMDDGTAAADPEQLTNFTIDGVRDFDVGGDGAVIVLERQTDLYVWREGAGEPRLLSIDMPRDYRFDPVERRTFTGDASNYAVSPNGKYIAFTVRGELFVTRNSDEDSRTVRLTNHPYRDQDPAWLDDSTLVFISDREGQYDLYRSESADPAQPDLYRSLKHRAVRLTETAADESGPVLAPDGKHLAFRRGNGTLIVAEIDGGQIRNERVLLDGWAQPSGVTWSPDSRWLAYSLSDLDFNDEVYIHAADGSREPVNVTQHPKGDGAPVWSRDGSKLGFLSDRNNGDADVWFVWLRAADWQKTQEDWQELKEEKELAGKKAESDSTKAGSQPVEIDFERIWERLQQVTSLPGNESDPAISADGEWFYFVSNRGGRQSYDADQDLHKVKWDGSEMEALTSGDQSPYDVRLGPQGKYLFMRRSGGRLARIDPNNGKLESLSFAARMDIDHPREREQIYGEAWRVLRDGFYDPNFHGADWEALGEKYRGWAMRASTDRDFRDVFNMLLGELNASHLGLYGQDRAETQRERTGLLGVEIDPIADGVRVARVVPRSPADRETSRLEAGDVIVAVDGMSVAEAPNFYALLADRADERT
ncbi:MAG: PDZ domain-containing protein, partial [Gemmatimonadales bacterium]